ncbi:MAG: Asp-tRNA(Asn)/Glu-tRNA(Gln) amidotransferase subunit GatC [Candidatus Omnitrophica bacterium]|nr:Asp-tRNA(Asn)/Glu-tRNA(Gln) amidotransferase subunit GatC [Candidatus Omnitrophota bacterium]
MAKISKEDVDYVSCLAKIRLKKEELEKYQKDLEEILLYIEKLKALPTERVKATAHILPIVNCFRKDRVRKGLDRKAALANAPAKRGSYFQVPKVI